MCILASPHIEGMTDKRIHSGHSVEKPWPGAETDAQGKHSCHPCCLEKSDEGEKHARTWKFIKAGKIIYIIFIYRVTDWYIDYCPRPGHMFLNQFLVMPPGLLQHVKCLMLFEVPGDLYFTDLTKMELWDTLATKSSPFPAHSCPQ